MGTLLLMLPISTRSGMGAGLREALFTATSASCVTGLIVQDTYTFWSPFGQAVILVLIQLGGLGFMTIATLFSLLLRRKIGIRERELLSESINSSHIGGIVRLTKRSLSAPSSASWRARFFSRSGSVRISASGAGSGPRSLHPCPRFVTRALI